MSETRYDLFVSCHADDRSSVEYIAQRLESIGLRAWTMFRMLAGTPFREAIDEALLHSKFVLVCIGAKGVTPWQESEISAAIDAERTGRLEKVVPVLLPGVALGRPGDVGVPPLLATFQAVDFRDGLTNEQTWKPLFDLLGVEAPPAKPPSTKPKSGKTRERRAVSVALIEDGRVLLVQRDPLKHTTGGGMWQLPGGKIKPDERPIDAAWREVEEEVGFNLPVDSLHEINEVADVWLDRRSGEAMIMHLFWAQAPEHGFRLGREFLASDWTPLADVFSRPNRTYFGSAAQFIRMIRRHLLLHRPLMQLADCLESGGHTRIDLPNVLAGLSAEATQLLYAVLSLLGFLDDRGRFSAASVLSVSLVRTLAAWASTGGQIFEARGVDPSDDEWYRLAVQKGDAQKVDRYRSGVFQQHENLLGFLSHRLQKALSSRTVADVLLIVRDRATSRRYLLLRWDFLAEKFQIPARGLELAEAEPSSSAAARYVVENRLDPSLADSFDFRYVGVIDTAHVSAGSLDDGPLMRRYEVHVFALVSKSGEGEVVASCLSAVNAESVRTLRDRATVESNQRKNLRFYVWADLEAVMKDRVMLLGQKLQGVEEILQHFGPTVFSEADAIDVDLDHCGMPVITPADTTERDTIEFVLGRFADGKKKERS